MKDKIFQLDNKLQGVLKPFEDLLLSVDSVTDGSAAITNKGMIR
jgi:hypothetical protein